MWRMSDSGAAGALAALLDQSVVAMAAKGAPGPAYDRPAVQDLADMWQEHLMPLFAVMLTRSERQREARARDLLAWMAGHGPVRRRVMLDLAAGAGLGLRHLMPWPHDLPVAPPEYTAERLALAGLQTLRIERDVLWPDGPAKDPRFDVDARRFLGPEPLRRTPETVADWSLRRADHTGSDLTRATVTALRIERLAGQWAAAVELDVPAPARSGAGFGWSEALHVWVGGLTQATFDSADTEGLRLGDGEVQIGAAGILRGADVTWTHAWFDLLTSRGSGPVQWRWPRGAAAAAARALFQALLEIRMVGRHRVVAGVPLAALTATIAGAGRDLMRAGRDSAALATLAARWQARPGPRFDALAGAEPPADPVLLAWHFADEWAAWHTPARWDGPAQPERPAAVYATAFDGDRLRGGQHLGPSRLRLWHRTDVLGYELDHRPP